MSFAWPWSFLFAIPVAFAVWRMFRKSKRAGVKFPAVNRLPVKTAGWRAHLASASPWLFSAALAMLIIAAARPRKPISSAKRAVEAIGIEMAVDVSGSMISLDMTPGLDVKSLLKKYPPRAFGLAVDPATLKRLGCKTRLDVVKDKFREFAALRPDDLIGLVTFGSFASTRMPLTADHEALNHVLSGVEIPIAEGETLTAIGDGLSVALARLEEQKELKSKIVILLSDGVSNAGDISPEDAADAAAKLGIKVYTIGVGAAGVALVPILSTTGANAEFLGAQWQDSEFDESQLKAIAAKTGGRYFAVGDNDALKNALSEIDKLEKTELEKTVYMPYKELGGPLLAAGAIVLMIAALVSVSATGRCA